MVTAKLMYMYLELHIYLVPGGRPATPMSPFKPHDVQFQSDKLGFSVKLERGFVVLTRTGETKSRTVRKK